MSGRLPDVAYWGSEWRDEWLEQRDDGCPALSGWAPDPAPARRLSPRCGRVMILDGRYERPGRPGDPGDPPVCGRPSGHNGPCRSEAAVTRANRASTARIREGRRAGRYRRYPAREAGDAA